MNAKELRKQTIRYREHKPCEVCGKHEAITHLHHVISLKDCAMLLNAVDAVNTPVVFLCPNCHAYIHQMQKGIFYNAMLNMSESDYKSLVSILKVREDAMSEIIEGLTDE